MKLHILNTQNALKISTLISLLYSFYSSSTIFSSFYAYFTTVIKRKVPKSIGGGPNKSRGLEKFPKINKRGGRQLGTLESGAKLHYFH